jgi:hypothetical protein
MEKVVSPSVSQAMRLPIFRVYGSGGLLLEPLCPEADEKMPSNYSLVQLHQKLGRYQPLPLARSKEIGMMRRNRWIFATLLMILPFATTSAEGFDLYADTENGFTIEHPADEGWSCGIGGYGAGYEEQFGCAGEMFKLVALPWTSSGGEFELNVQTSFVRGGENILGLIAEAMSSNEYDTLSASTAAGASGAGFVAPGGRRQVWYLLHGDLLLELNARLERDYREGEAHERAGEVLVRMVASVKFD